MIKKTFVLDLIKNKKGHQMIPTDIKSIIQSYLPNPIIMIQRAWRRYQHCTLKMDTMHNAYMSIDTICRQLYNLPRPGLVRHSSVSDPIQGNGEEWRCPYKNNLFTKKRVSFFRLAKFLNRQRKFAYSLTLNEEHPHFIVEREDHDPWLPNTDLV